MKKSLLLFFLLLAFSVCAFGQPQEKVKRVILKNGSILRGYIIETQSSDTLRLELVDGMPFVCQMSEVALIEDDRPELPVEEIAVEPEVQLPRARLSYISTHAGLGYPVTRSDVDGIALHGSLIHCNFHIRKNYGIVLNIEHTLEALFTGGLGVHSLSVGPSYTWPLAGNRIDIGVNVTGGIAYVVDLKPFSKQGVTFQPVGAVYATIRFAAHKPCNFFMRSGLRYQYYSIVSDTQLGIAFAW